MPFNSNSRILITGGTGSFGKAFIAETLRRFPDIQRLVVYSRDELKQWELQKLYPLQQSPQSCLFLGDVRDRRYSARNELFTYQNLTAINEPWSSICPRRWPKGGLWSSPA
ncbi:polysaccharide biosynthesis protein [Synechococcus sp. CBW1006]|uniref:polysaccharide biosynthesis protein n=1 Tax=Synechococcus sp. CBW1006 TaxID=1353138 RepID=UPI001E466AAA|nr:polysaccharide biosynthesis protein [Synechococcus sp. CBW1006]